MFHDCLSPKIQIYFGAIYMLWNLSCDESFYMLRTELRNILDWNFKKIKILRKPNPCYSLKIQIRNWNASQFKNVCEHFPIYLRQWDCYKFTRCHYTSDYERLLYISSTKFLGLLNLYSLCCVLALKQGRTVTSVL